MLFLYSYKKTLRLQGMFDFKLLVNMDLFFPLHREKHVECLKEARANKDHLVVLFLRTICI